MPKGGFVVEKETKEFLKSYPYLEAPKGYWIDSDKKTHDITDVYEFSNKYLKSCYLMLSGQYRNIDWKKNSLPESGFIKKLFEKKISELENEIQKRRLPDFTE